MSFTAPKSSGGGSFEKHPPGPTSLVCTKIIDKGSVFNPVKQEEKRKIMFVFESDKKMTEGEYVGQPFLVFANFNFSMYQNSLMCKFIEGWLGTRFTDQGVADAFDLTKLLGRSLFANIVHNGDYVNIDSPMPVPEGMTIPVPVGDVFAFAFGAPDLAAWDKISEKMKEKMKLVPEYKQWVESPIPSPEGFETMPEAGQEAGQSGMADDGSGKADDGFNDSIPF